MDRSKLKKLQQDINYLVNKAGFTVTKNRMGIGLNDARLTLHFIDSAVMKNAKADDGDFAFGNAPAGSIGYVLYNDGLYYPVKILEARRSKYLFVWDGDEEDKRYLIRFEAVLPKSKVPKEKLSNW